MAEGIVGPGDIAGRCKRRAASGHIAALSDGVHAIVITGNDVCASFVFLYVEDVAVRFVGVGYGVRGAGDGGEEVAVWDVGITELFLGSGSSF